MKSDGEGGSSAAIVMQIGTPFGNLVGLKSPTNLLSAHLTQCLAHLGRRCFPCGVGQLFKADSFHDFLRKSFGTAFCFGGALWG